MTKCKLSCKRITRKVIEENEKKKNNSETNMRFAINVKHSIDNGHSHKFLLLHCRL